MYFDAYHNTNISDTQLAELGLADADKNRLAELGIYTLDVQYPDADSYDPQTQGIRPVGSPQADPDDPFRYIQHMEVYDFLAELKASKKDGLASYRWSRQTMGLETPEGYTFSTTPEDFSRMSATVQNLKNLKDLQPDQVKDVDFKIASGWIKLPLSRLEVVASTIAVYTQACYAREKELAEAIDQAQSLEELNAVDITDNWPKNAPERVDPDTEDAEEKEEEIRAATLAEARSQSSLVLTRNWQEAEAVGVLESSVGFSINANERANRDITGLIAKLESTGQATTVYCDANDAFHEVSLDQLRTMQLELIEFGQKVYAAKWRKRTQIENAASLEELAQVDLMFGDEENSNDTDTDKEQS